MELRLSCINPSICSTYPTFIIIWSISSIPLNLALLSLMRTLTDSSSARYISSFCLRSSLDHSCTSVTKRSFFFNRLFFNKFSNLFFSVSNYKKLSQLKNDCPGAETRMFHDNWINTAATDALVLCIAKSAATMVLTRLNGQVLVFQVSLMLQYDRKCTYIFMFSQINSAQQRLIVMQMSK